MGTRRLILNIEPGYISDDDVSLTAARSPTPEVSIRDKNVRAKQEKTMVTGKLPRQSYGVM